MEFVTICLFKICRTNFNDSMKVQPLYLTLPLASFIQLREFLPEAKTNLIYCIFLLISNIKYNGSWFVILLGINFRITPITPLKRKGKSTLKFRNFKHLKINL